MTGGPRAAWSVLLGVVAIATIPVAVIATRYSDSYDLLHAGFAIPVALASGIASIALARRARTQSGSMLDHTGPSRSARAGRLLGMLGICIAASATIALAVYGVLVAVD